MVFTFESGWFKTGSLIKCIYSQEKRLIYFVLEFLRRTCLQLFLWP